MFFDHKWITGTRAAMLHGGTVSEDEREIATRESDSTIAWSTATRCKMTCRVSKYSFMAAFDGPGPFSRGQYNRDMLPEVNITQWRKGSQWV
ncbi:putative core-2/I-branching beta-1,6-N-acetylglucosaminyltransferase family protein [Tanacetum coccineum]